MNFEGKKKNENQRIAIAKFLFLNILFFRKFISTAFSKYMRLIPRKITSLQGTQATRRKLNFECLLLHLLSKYSQESTKERERDSSSQLDVSVNYGNVARPSSRCTIESSAKSRRLAVCVSLVQGAISENPHFPKSFTDLPKRLKTFR